MNLGPELKRINFYFSHFERKKNFSVRVFPSIEAMINRESKKHGFSRSQFVSAAIVRLVDSHMDEGERELLYKFQIDILKVALAQAYSINNEGDDVA